MYIGHLANILIFRDNLPKSGAAEEKCYAFIIKQHPRCMQKAIVDALDTDKGSVSRAVAKLIERGLVEKDQRDALMATS
ncbi:helix-turn-helix domain-containing protein [Roseovarius sp. 10]|uniref:helix-turn-helix transcriptional regulator n=1 Tax=Roseovarius sp. 10 TaxID=3080563 RepID=UPI002955AB52|nr:helix-turn-helix domain-containing protein [Roseovarius sp. 10]MDV7202150.1 helix-turn-helix domain-containing protein [Roseovarius sp. 10]